MGEIGEGQKRAVRKEGKIERKEREKEEIE